MIKYYYITTKGRALVKAQLYITKLLPTSQASEDARPARRQRIVPREECSMQKNSRTICNKVLANCNDGSIRAIVVLSQSGGALHLD